MGSTVASFAGWLVAGSPVAVATFFALNALVWWFITLAHELGHAAVGLARTEGLVVVKAGRSSPKWRRRFGRLSLELGPVPLIAGGDGVAEIYAGLGRTSKVAFALAGPAAGAVAAALLIVLASRFQFRPLEIIGWVALGFDLANLVPFRVRGDRSDGLYLLHALRSGAPARREDPVADRWLALVTNARPTFERCDPEILAAVLVLLGRARNDRGDEGRTLIRLALAGWCWRRAERGDTTPIRDHVLDVRHRAALKGLPREGILVAAAAELARGEARLAAASPTADSLARGFEHGVTVEPPASLPEDQQRFAFHFGVAMHDVVAIAG